MGISDRIEGSVENWSSRWGDRLRDWMAAWLAWGFELILDLLGKVLAPKLRPLIETLEQTGEVPDELRPLLDEMKTPQGEIAAMLGWSASGGLIGGAVGKITDAMFLRLGYNMMARVHPVIPTVEQALAYWLRGAMPDEDLDRVLSGHGLDFHTRDIVKEIAHARLDVASVQELHRRDPEVYGALWKDVKDQGLDPGRIALFKELSKIIPPLPDMVRFADFGAFDPTVIQAWREFYDAPDWIRKPMAKIGIEGDWADRYWFSHWRQPGRYELAEMHRRGLIDDDIVKMAYLTQGYSSFWQTNLLELVKEVPTRVDVRRWWDMRTISEDELREIYHRQGYYDKDLDNYVLWTKVYVAFPDLMARWRNGWITLDEVRAELTALGMPAARVEEMIETKIKTAEPERISKERDVTKSDIIKGVKTGVITRTQGVELLIELGYDEDEAVYILEINIPPDDEDAVVAQRQLSKADILKGLKTEVITRVQASDRLLDLRYSPVDTEFLLKIYDAQITPPVEPRAREASKADIISAVKKGLITPEEGYLMLQDIDFTPEAAMFILEVKAEVSPFSPINYAEFKDRSQKYRQAVGKEAKPMPEELIKAAAKVVKLTQDIEALKKAIIEEGRTLIDEKILPEAATAKRDELRVALHRAESALARAQSTYDGKLAAWKHQEKT